MSRFKIWKYCMLALQDGYLAETYRTITDDGYIIQATRIIGRGKDLKNQPILMMHGLLSASDDWLLRGPHRDLPYMLADLGYDVWLGDWRGNCFSRGHVSLSTSDSRYWNTTYYFRGIHDLPAFIDLVLNVSKYDRLVYVGYSFGTTSFMVMASMLPNYAEKIALAVLLSPIGVKLENGYHFVEHIAREIVESVPEGILKLSKQLPNVVLLKKIEYEKFGHLDFVVGKNAENVLYKHVLQTIVDFDNF
ncbi:unnamed protein product [Nesidiocoris tenuis]|uniref:Partial AB-hydrolase lipase domain-containing protein n=1 Tax=Nesidiocoris tenuis TaxID=355587 RepID=A0A6H5G8Y1_9HEMI|nr:unnamed protein product [Nesidiocoris tenuis]